MKKTVIISLLLAVGLTITGCAPSGNYNVEQAPEQSQIEPAPQEPALTSEELYLQVVRGMGNPIVANATDYELIDVGNSVCDALASGYTVEDIAYAIVIDSPNESDSYYEFAGIIIGGASSTLCPAYSTT